MHLFLKWLEIANFFLSKTYATGRKHITNLAKHQERTIKKAEDGVERRDKREQEH